MLNLMDRLLHAAWTIFVKQVPFHIALIMFGKINPVFLDVICVKDNLARNLKALGNIYGGIIDQTRFILKIISWFTYLCFFIYCVIFLICFLLRRRVVCFLFCFLFSFFFLFIYLFIYFFFFAKIITGRFTVNTFIIITDLYDFHPETFVLPREVWFWKAFR